MNCPRHFLAAFGLVALASILPETVRTQQSGESLIAEPLQKDAAPPSPHTEETTLRDHGDVSEKEEKDTQRVTNADVSEETCPIPDPVSARPDALRIGVRHYSRPFSYYSENLREVWSASPQAPLALKKYTGYMSKICDAVLADMLLNPPASDTAFELGDIEIVDVDCLSIRDEKAGTARTSRLEYLADEIDILCDPATISNARRHGFILSPPVFLSGIGLISRDSNQVPRRGNCPPKPLIGHVRSTNAAQTGIPRVLDTQEIKAFSELLRSYVQDGTNQCSTALGDKTIVKDYDNHFEAAKGFCEGDFYYYIGDREIITYNARNIPGCGAELDGVGQTYSNDRYAIFGRFGHREASSLRDQRIARFFEILSQKIVISPSVLDKAYEDTFFEEPSRKLESFYWSIRGPRRP